MGTELPGRILSRDDSAPRGAKGLARARADARVYGLVLASRRGCGNRSQTATSRGGSPGHGVRAIRGAELAGNGATWNLTV
jgi:hypothetical protein